MMIGSDETDKNWERSELMAKYQICTQKYDVDIPRLLERRLAQCGAQYGVLSADAGCVLLEVSCADAADALAQALSLLLTRDLLPFELARMADPLPLSLAEKQEVVTSALHLARQEALPRGVRAALAQYLADWDEINLEGYLQFRMQDVLSFWQGLVERAAAEQLLCREYTELMGVLSAFVQLQQPRIGELSVCLNPDGSCTLTDDSDARIEYVDCSEDGIVGLLVSMAPARLTVYDLSGGRAKSLSEAIQKVFAGRVRIYR